MKYILSIMIVSIFTVGVFAQKLPAKEGLYKGTMYLYRQGIISDSVTVELKIEVLQPDSAWKWQTKYLSEKMPMTKDYKLVSKDATKGFYATDEGENIILYDFLFGNKLYSQFETHEILLTSSYEWIGNDQIIFEVTSAKKEKETPEGISNYKINHLQRVVFKKIK